YSLHAAPGKHRPDKHRARHPLAAPGRPGRTFPAASHARSRDDRPGHAAPSIALPAGAAPPRLRAIDPVSWHPWHSPAGGELKGGRLAFTLLRLRDAGAGHVVRKLMGQLI